eukprot:CAMPEP_0171030934 /NCGR_PEP_ID=MMETSP0736-20130129/37331_1 /TAXON_ID=186038 /ORGANISM="Fragilariopsis kerguelensis, Strain L26-C5" /LENGTH=38 /DNA_ID= /DNA_START= /DNA_END= /DNA_ORIENTATION=
MFDTTDMPIYAETDSTDEDDETDATGLPREYQKPSVST